MNIYMHTFLYVVEQLYKEKDYSLAAEMWNALNIQLSNRFRGTNNNEKCPGTVENLKENRTQSHM